jgi:D-sedoheptulose 7-phosphate isomerase
MDRDHLLDCIKDSAGTIAALADRAAEIGAAADTVVDALQSGAKVLTAGNGGSSAEALHMAEEIVGRFRGNRASLPAVCLAADSTALTCIANDFGYDCVFSRQVEGLGKRGDVLVLFSTTGSARNLESALEAARARGITVISLLGRDGGALHGRSDHEILVAGSATERIQEAHQVVLHLVLDAIEKAFPPAGTEKP